MSPDAAANTAKLAGYLLRWRLTRLAIISLFHRSDQQRVPNEEFGDGCNQTLL